MESYDYKNRTGVQTIDWGDFARLTRQLSQLVGAFDPDVIVGVAKAGLFPATAVACALRCELIPVRISRRVDDVVVHSTPQWRVPLTAGLAGKRVAVIDDISDSGETLSMVSAHTRENGAPEILTASLVSHSWSDPAPDVCSLITDDLVVLPWDQQVREGDRWSLHPEIADAVEMLEGRAPKTAELKPSDVRQLKD